MDFQKIAIILLVLALGVFIGYSAMTPAPAAAPSPTAVLTPSPTPAPSPSPAVEATSTPTPVATAEPAVSATPTPSPTPSGVSIDALGSAVESATNSALSKRNSSKSISFDRLVYTVGALTNQPRTYYEGEVTSVLSENGTLTPLQLTVSVYGVYNGENNLHEFSAASVVTIEGRQVSITESPSSFKASVYCANGTYWVYAERAGVSTLTAKDLFGEIAKVCPA